MPPTILDYCVPTILDYYCGVFWGIFMSVWVVKYLKQARDGESRRVATCFIILMWTALIVRITIDIILFFIK